MSTNPPQTPPTALELHTETTDGGTLVRCRGRSTYDAAARFKNQVRPLIAETPKLVIDLSDIAYMDSSGLGAVVSLYVSAKKAGCEFQLINFNARVRQLLGMTNVLSIFETCGKFMIKM